MFGCIRIRLFYLFVLITFVASSALLFAPTSVPVFSKLDGIFLPVIMYHSVMPDSYRCGEYVISADTLESDLRYLHENGYKSVLPSELVAFTQGKGTLPKKAVMITFDDGFYNNLTVALPLLIKYDMTAVVSVIGAYAEKSEAEKESNPHYSYCTYEQMRELALSGRIEIGNHTYDMHKIGERRGCMKLPYESDLDYVLSLSEDIKRLDSSLSQVGIDPVTFAYPFGFISPESVPVLYSLGYKVTFSCVEKGNYITKDKNCLFGIARYNRPYSCPTETFMNKILTE